MRPETGPMQFRDDWRGLFIRGDNALLYFLPALHYAIEKLQDEQDIVFKEQLVDLAGLLESTNHHVPDENVQMMGNFEDCHIIKKQREP